MSLKFCISQLDSAVFKYVVFILTTGKDFKISQNVSYVCIIYTRTDHGDYVPIHTHIYQYNIYYYTTLMLINYIKKLCYIPL